MSDEDAIQARLDDDPGNGWLRRVLADCLDEQGDPRAAGYRALGELGRAPFDEGTRNETGWTYWVTSDVFEPSELREAWWKAWKAAAATRHGGDPALTAWAQNRPDLLPYRFPTRREADDAAALAFAALAPAERDEILSGAPTPESPPSTSGGLA